MLSIIVGLAARRAGRIVGCALVVALSSGACHEHAPVAASGGVATPKLVVLVVLDQWPAWAFDRKRPHLTQGFQRLLAEGEWHVGEHPSAATLTAPGHTLLGTGATPATSGILANEWWHRDLERSLGSVEDADGSVTTRWLRVAGLGDSIAAAGRGGKAVALSLKDRAALLSLGHHGTAIWYDRKAVRWASTTKPAWLAPHDASIRAVLDATWTPLDPARLAALSGTIDAQPGEVGEKGFDATFPHALAETADPADALFASPFGNAVLLDAAVAAIEGEALGVDAIPDLLVVSLSAHDLVGHGWGQESWEMWDLTLRLDAQLAEFLAALDARVGAGRWSMIVTSDHGASPMPEHNAHGGRLVFDEIKALANRAASAALGEGEWIAFASYPTLYASAALRALPVADRERALAAIIIALRAVPGIAWVERTAELAGNCAARTGDAALVCQMLDPERSGEIVWFPADGWVAQDDDERLATAHGSPHSYDRRVPVLVLQPGRTRHAPRTAPRAPTIPMSHIATILAAWLGVAPPSTLPPPRA